MRHIREGLKIISSCLAPLCVGCFSRGNQTLPVAVVGLRGAGSHFLDRNTLSRYNVNTLNLGGLVWNDRKQKPRGVIMEYKDYYKILGVSKGATEKEIKQAYRKLARKYHPDVNPGDTKAEERFKEINEAYQVLIDPEKRKKYDQLGADWQRYQQAGGRPGGFNWADYFSQASAGGQRRGEPRVEYVDASEFFGGRGTSGFSDFFEALFGGMGGVRPTGTWQSVQQEVPRRRQTYEQQVDITLEEAYQGTTRTLQLDGRRLEVKIPPGVKTGSKVRVAGEVGKGAYGQPGDDLFLKVNVLPHPTFERRGDNLYVDVPVDIYTAALGGEIRVPTLRGKTLSLRVPPETQGGRTFRLQGQGMPRLHKPSEHGDLYVRVRIMLPIPLSDREKASLQELAALRK